MARALGPVALPPPLAALHSGRAGRYAGQITVTRGSGALAALACALGRFPPACTAARFVLEVTPDGADTLWARHVGAHVTRSRLRFDPRRGGPVERFGAITCALSLRHDGALEVGVTRAWLLGLPLPRGLTPLSTSREWAEGARIRFDIRAALPGGRPLIRYHGWAQAENAV